MSYQVVADILGNHESRKVANNSYLVHTEGKCDREGHPGQAGTIAYKLHDTYVVLWHANGTVELNTGGWRTVTTKDRINRCLRDYGEPRGYAVWSTRGVWGLHLYGKLVAEFADGMFIHPDGTITGAMTAEDMRKRDESNAKLTKLVKAYIKGLTPEIIVKACENVAGDCLFCQMHVASGEPIGDYRHRERSNAGSHLWDHLEERYYMGSLFANAVDFCKYGPAMGPMILMAAKGETYGNKPHVDPTLARCLSRYFYAYLRIA